jgi:hypothetical protein
MDCSAAPPPCRTACLWCWLHACRTPLVELAAMIDRLSALQVRLWSPAWLTPLWLDHAAACNVLVFVCDAEAQW